MPHVQQRLGGVQGKSRAQTTSSEHSSAHRETLAPAVRSEMERTFAADLRGLVVHNDRESWDSAAARGFAAYTIGSDVYFGEDRFQPISPQGKSLLAHETVHVLQQRAERPANGHTSSNSAAAETEARHVAASVVDNRRFEPVGVPAQVGIQGAPVAEAGTVEPPGQTASSPPTALPTDTTSPSGQSPMPPTLAAALEFIDNPALQVAAEAVLPSGMVPNLKKLKAFVLGAWAIYQNPSIVIDPIKASFAQLIDQIPAKVEEAIAEVAVKYGSAVAAHLSGVWRHLEPKLVYLKDNWWEVLKETGHGLLFPWEGMSEDVDKLGLLFNTAKVEFEARHWSKAADAVIDAWRAGNNIAGRWYGWFLLAMALIGGIVGAIFGAGVGFIPGVIAGAEAAFTVGKVLLVSTVAAEGANLLKAAGELALGNPTDEEAEDKYERIASSGLTLGIIGVMFVIGEIAAKFVQWLFRRLAKALGREAPLPKADEARAVSRGEKGRAESIKKGVAERDEALETGKKAPRKGPEDDLDWLKGDPHKKELSYDPDTKHYRINEGKAAVAAEDSGVLDGPLRRAPKDSGADFLDAKGRSWSHKGGPRVDNVVEQSVAEATRGKNVLADLSELNPVERAAARAQIAAGIKGVPNPGAVRFVPPFPSPAPAVGTLGKQIGEKVDQPGGATK